MMVDNKLRAPLSSYIGPDPLDENAYPETGCGKELKMDCPPRKPCNESAQAKFPALQNAESLANHRHVPLVKIAERRRSGSARHARPTQLSRISSLLNCHLLDAWQRPAVLIERCSVARDQNLGM